ncbi:Tat pathway signal sequence domain protein [Acetobacteraceae bacterium AT-5844]|nr:Tat pathway signal sequence domain protein [Acetobacteraceae bacterium AT-5844]
MRTNQTGRRGFLALLPLLTGCTAAGGPWPHLSETQETDAEAWKQAVQEHVAATLSKAGLPVSSLGAIPALGAPSGQLSFALVVDRSGFVHMVEVMSTEPDRAQIERLILNTVTEAGPLPPPPASLVAFGNGLKIQITLSRQGQPVSSGRA